MQRVVLERRLRGVHADLVRAREELAVLEEQLALLADAADDARIRSLVSETPLATREYAEAQRHADAMSRARVALMANVTALERRQDELLSHVGGDR